MRGAKVLIVDDEEGIRETLRAVLEDERFLVDAAENGQDAIAKSKAKFRNLALVDVHLPDTDDDTVDILGGNHSEDGQLKCPSSMSRYYGLARK